jgi:hypothetical protein
VPETTARLAIAPAITLREDMSCNDAVKIDALAARILGDIGSVYRRAFDSTDGLPPELVTLRRYVRELQDAVRDAKPEAFYK